MNKFDSIRPYEDSEVEAVLSSLCSNVNVIRALIDSSDSSLISLLPFKEKIISLYLKHKTKMRVDLRITCLLVLVFNSELMFDVVCNGVIDIYVAQLFVEDFQCQFSGQLL